MIASGSDDSTLRLWDSRNKKPIYVFKESYQVLSAALSANCTMVFCAGIEGGINAWDIRNESIAYTISAHSDAVTGLKLSPDGQSLLSFGADNALMVWDVRSVAFDNMRHQSVLGGCAHGFEKNLVRPCWSPDGYYVACGSADKTVMVWDLISKGIVYKLPGHKGAVNEVAWSDNLILSCSNDATLFIGELDVEKVKF